MIFSEIGFVFVVIQKSKNRFLCCCGSFLKPVIVMMFVNSDNCNRCRHLFVMKLSCDPEYSTALHGCNRLSATYTFTVAVVYVICLDFDALLCLVFVVTFDFFNTRNIT